jgi:hypothetical protein
MAAVVLYSVALSRGIAAEPGEPTVEELLVLNNVQEKMTQELDQGNQYRELMQKLSVQLAGGSVALADATAQIAVLERSHKPEWQRYLREAFPGCSDRECLAANLMTHTLAELRAEPDTAEVRKAQLAQEFRALFGHEPPTPQMIGTSTPVGTQTDSDESPGFTVDRPATKDFRVPPRGQRMLPRPGGERSPGTPRSGSPG